MNKRDLRLNCFSPPVMLATFVLEFGMAAYTIWRYKLTAFTRVTIAMLVCLGIFQLAEYNICATGWFDHTIATRIGHAAITLLPALGVHLVFLGSAVDPNYAKYFGVRAFIDKIKSRFLKQNLAARSKKKLSLSNYQRASAMHSSATRIKGRYIVWAAYVNAAFFASLFLFMDGALTGAVCRPNYATFMAAPWLGEWFGYYYFFWLAVGIFTSLLYATKIRWGLLAGAIVGYLIFLLPTAIVNFAVPSSMEGTASIMCGFAVFFAFILTFWIMPLSGVKKRG